MVGLSQEKCIPYMWGRKEKFHSFCSSMRPAKVLTWNIRITEQKIAYVEYVTVSAKTLHVHLQNLAYFSKFEIS